MTDKTWIPAIDLVKKAIKAEKEKHKNKTWKNLSSGDKDYILFLLAKAAGAVPKDMAYE